MDPCVGRTSPPCAASLNRDARRRSIPLPSTCRPKKVAIVAPRRVLSRRLLCTAKCRITGCRHVSSSSPQKKGQGHLAMHTPVPRPLRTMHSVRGWHRRPIVGLVGILVSCVLSVIASLRPPRSHAQDAAEPFDFQQASRHVMKPREVWPLVNRHTVPLAFRVLSDETRHQRHGPFEAAAQGHCAFREPRAGRQEVGPSVRDPVCPSTPAVNREPSSGGARSS